MLKKYRIGFDFGGLVLSLLIMLPNFFWFAFPAPKDILRADSKTAVLDTIASLCQVWMIAALCFIRHRGCGKLRAAPLPVLAGVCVLAYYAGWLAYYQGLVGVPVIGALTLPPCLAFLFYAVDRKNLIAVVPACLFTVCHAAYAACNFLL